MINIVSIKIYGFKASNRAAEVNFSEDSVSVIFGPNGCGKTSFLKVLYGVLAQNETFLSENLVGKVTIKFKFNNELREVNVIRDIEGSYNWDEVANSRLGLTSSLSLGVDRGTTAQLMKPDPLLIRHFFASPQRRHYLADRVSSLKVAEELSEFLRRNQIRNRNRNRQINFDKRNLYLQDIKIENIEELLRDRYQLARITASKKIQSALFDTLSLAISVDDNHRTNKKLPNNFEIRLRDNNARIREALDDGFENKFKNKVIETLDSIATSDQDGVERIKSHPILSQLFLNIIKELENEKLILSSINLLVDTFNEYLIEGKKLVVNSEEVYVVVGEDKHSVNELSSGERHILTFLSLVLFEGESRDFLIIDEPEISLNIRWQRELLSLFKKLVPNTQIIVASHSPTLVKGNMDYLCELEVGAE